MSLSTLILFIIFLRLCVAVKTDQTASVPNSKQIHLKQGEHDASLSVDNELTHVQLFCSFGYHWILPELAQSFVDLFEIQPSMTNTSGSQLSIHISKDNTIERLHLRGLYQCCPTESMTSHSENVKLAFRAHEPSCCPCCPWFEQHQCTYGWNTDSNSFLPKPYQINCSSLYLYTNVVPLDYVELDITRSEPILIPCASPTESTTNFKIDHQLIPSAFAREPWFPFDSHLKTSIRHVYDPRFGLCLFKSQFPRPVYVLKCTYKDKERLVQPRWPPPSPAIKPDVFIKFQRINDGVTSQETPGLSNSYSDLIMEKNMIASTYRLSNQTYLKARCVATYMDHRIVSQPPWSMCFQWQIRPYQIDLNDSSKPPATYAKDQWNLPKCRSIQISNYSKQPIVESTDELKLPRLAQNLSITCRAIPPSRESPSDEQTTHLLVIGQDEDRINQSLKTYFSTDAYTELLNMSQTLVTSRNYTQMVESYAIFYTNQPIQLHFGFWTLDEVGIKPRCDMFVCPSTPIQCPLTIDNHILRRQGDRWVCSINITDNASLSGSVMNVTIGVSQMFTMFHLVMFDHIKLLKPKVEGLHGDVEKPMLLQCKSEIPKIRIGKNVSLGIPRKIIWNLEWDNKFEIRENEMLNISLFIQPIYDKSAHPKIEFELENGTTIRTNYNHSLGEPWTIERWPRQLCVSCAIVYHDRSNDSSTIPSEKSCHTLSEDNIQSSNVVLWSRFNNHTIKFPIQLNHELVTVPILKGSQIRVDCRVPNSLTLSWQKFINQSAWPTIQVHNSLNQSTTPAYQEKVIISPYSKVFSINLPMSNQTDNETYYTFSYANQTLAFRFKILEPIKPKILEPQQNSRLYEEGSQVELKCMASGVPKPAIEWRLFTQTDSTDQEANNQWTVLKGCKTQDLQAQSQNNSFCIHSMNTSDTGPILVQCYVHNLVGQSIMNVTLTGLSSSQEFYVRSAGLGYHLFWTLVILLPLLVIIVLITSLVCFKLRKMNIYANLMHIQNLLYRKTYHHGTRNDETNQALLHVFGTLDEVIRFTIPRNSIQITPISLGLGHYGQVMKGWLDWKYVEPYEPTDPLDKEHKVPVAVKTCSGDLSSLKCLQNEISLLSRLNQNPNVVKMFGLLVGQNPNLTDTSLVMEYCDRKSLNEFIRKHAHLLRRYPNSMIQSSHRLDSTDSGLGDPTEGCLQSDSNETKSSDGTRRNHAHHEIGIGSVPVQYFKFGVRDLYSISYGIANGLEYLAKNNIIHRDLATRNILLSNKMIPKICDFGLAVRCLATKTNDDTGSDDYCNTNPDQEQFYRIITFTKQLPFRILPPEALQDQLFYFASDIWQFGLLLWQLFHLEDKKPFNSIKTVDQLFNLLKANSQHCHDAPAERIRYGYLDKPYLMINGLWELICRMWSFGHEQRPSATEVRRLMGKILETSVDMERELAEQYTSGSNHYLDIVGSNEQYDETLPRMDDNKSSTIQHGYVNQIPCPHNH